MVKLFTDQCFYQGKLWTKKSVPGNAVTIDKEDHKKIWCIIMSNKDISLTGAIIHRDPGTQKHYGGGLIHLKGGSNPG